MYNLCKLHECIGVSVLVIRFFTFSRDSEPVNRIVKMPSWRRNDAMLDANVAKLRCYREQLYFTAF